MAQNGTKMFEKNGTESVDCFGQNGLSNVFNIRQVMPFFSSENSLLRVRWKVYNLKTSKRPPGGTSFVPWPTSYTALPLLALSHVLGIFSTRTLCLRIFALAISLSECYYPQCPCNSLPHFPWVFDQMTVEKPPLNTVPLILLYFSLLTLFFKRNLELVSFLIYLLSLSCHYNVSVQRVGTLLCSLSYPVPARLRYTWL